jgi:UDP-glucose 4-epimerase
VPHQTKKKILITGGAGFVGTNLAHALVGKDFEVRILDNLSTGLESNVSSECDFFEGDILSGDLVNKMAKDCDAIFHLAALGSVPRSIKAPNQTFEVNFKGTLNVLDSARERRIPIIFSSSSSVYGANQTIPKNEYDWLSPLSPYAASKLAAEGAISSYANSYKLPTSILRFFNVYGRFQRFDHPYAAVFPRWIHCLEHKTPISVYGDGNQSRDFTHVSNVTFILIQTLEKSIYSPIPTNLAFGKPNSLNEIIEEFRKFYPELEVEYKAYREGDIQHSSNLPQRLHSLFGELNVVPLSEGLKDTIEWYRSMIARN